MSNNTSENSRRSGRTTRLLDAAIQELFVKGEVILKDHEEFENRFIHVKFIERLNIEHKLLFTTNRDQAEGMKGSIIYNKGDYFKLYN